jgi:hypothetical protein
MGMASDGCFLVWRFRFPVGDGVTFLSRFLVIGLV